MTASTHVLPDPPDARIYAQFPFFNLMNSQDTFAQLILKPHSRVTVRTDYHWLRLSEKRDLWYAGGGATNAYYGHAFGQGVVKHTFAGADANYGYLELMLRY